MYTVFFRIKLSKGGTKGIDEIVFFYFLKTTTKGKKISNLNEKKMIGNTNFVLIEQK